MSDITVRNVRLSFEGAIDFDVSDDELGGMLPSLALSMTMPYLEPYLIRTMKVALKKITDPELAEDVRRFSQQEGHHFRNHAMFNDQIRAHFDPATTDSLREIEAALEADYQRFSRTKGLRFNVGYAEGFEAMTCAGALAAAEHMAFDSSKGDSKIDSKADSKIRSNAKSPMPGGDIWAWHMAEEIEHRTVAFDVFGHLVGSYFYRIFGGCWAQWHYVSYILRFQRCMVKGLGRKPGGSRDAVQTTALRNYLRTLSPFYDPAKIEMPAGVEELLAKFSAQVGIAQTQQTQDSP